MFDGNGTFNRLMNWVQDAASGIKIKADRHDQQDDDFANGLTNCLTKDGQTQPSNNIPMNGKKLVNLATPTDDTDAATKNYVDLFNTFKSGAVISGADSNGQINFSSATGLNGLTFTGADLSWLAKLATAAVVGPPAVAATQNRMVLNDKVDGSGNDVIIANEDGSLLAARLISTGPSALIQIKPTSGNGQLAFYNADGVTAQMNLFTTSGAQGHGYLTVGAQTYTFGNNGNFVAPGPVTSGTSQHGTDGNITGAVWANWGANDAFSAINARIETRAQTWANDRVANLQYRKVSRGSTGGLIDGDCPNGAVITGYRRESGQTGQVWNLYFKYLQIYDPVRGWVGFSEA